MSDLHGNRASYLKQAAACMEVAERMSLLDDRIHMLRMAPRLMEQADAVNGLPAQPPMSRKAG